MVKTKKHYKNRGQPTKYRPSFVQKLLEYCDIQPFVEKTVKGVNGFGIPFKKKVIVPNIMPTISRFAIDNNINEDTLVEWANAVTKTGKPKFPDFSAAYKTLKSVQKSFLTTNGLTGLYKENFSIFVAQNFTDMRQKVEHSSDPEKPVLVEIVNFSNANKPAGK